MEGRVVYYCYISGKFVVYENAHIIDNGDGKEHVKRCPICNDIYAYYGCRQLACYNNPCSGYFVTESDFRRGVMSDNKRLPLLIVQAAAEKEKRRAEATEERRAEATEERAKSCISMVLAPSRKSKMLFIPGILKWLDPFDHAIIPANVPTYHGKILYESREIPCKQYYEIKSAFEQQNP